MFPQVLWKICVLVALMFCPLVMRAHWEKSDDEQTLYAVSQRRAIVTHNRVDFEKQHRKFLESGMKHYGVIVAQRRRDAEVVSKLLALLDAVTAEEMQNQLRYI